MALTVALFAIPAPASRAEPGGPARTRASSAGVAEAPPITISPLPGTPDAPPATQISFLGAPARDLASVVVVGSRSGRHPGRLEDYATGTGASFLPARAFTPGETVTVSATLVRGARRVSVGTRFTVARPYRISPNAPLYYPTIPGSVASFASAAKLHPPTVFLTVGAADPAQGDIFLTPDGGDSQAGPMIVSPSGALVWFAPEPPGYQAANLQVQRYLGRRVLTYWQGRIALGHGIGDAVILDTHYRLITRVHAGNGLEMDMHDFVLGPDGTAYSTIFYPVHRNLSKLGGASNGLAFDCIVQEVDVRTGLVMYEWHALGHVPMRETYMRPVDDPTTIFDWFHINRIQILGGDDLLINARDTWATYKISKRTGRILWQLGGRRSSFKLGPGVQFAWQHDATRLPNGDIQIFDNEALPQIGPVSRGILVGLNFKTYTAKLLSTYTDPDQAVLSASQGDVQTLSEGDHFLGFGHVGLVSEVSPTGHLTFEMELAPSVESYRAFRFPWVATPTWKPTLAATRAPDAATTQVAASWNGATSVAAWQVLAGASPSTLLPVGPAVPSSGFETDITAPTSAPYVAVRALNAAGRTLATSPAALVAPAA